MDNWSLMYKDLWNQLGKDIDYYNHINKVFESYEKWIEQNRSELYIAIKNICSVITECIKSTMCGHPEKGAHAFFELCKGKELINNKNLDSISSITGEQDSKYLFRARIGKRATLASDLFHPPYSKRCFLKTERFSIAGTPCLYIGSSIYICHKELDQPDIGNMLVSRIEIDEKAKILDLSTKHNYYKVLSKLTNDDLIMFPLKYSANLAVLEKDRAFKTEYVIPQLITQYIADNSSIDGIAYNSVQVTKSISSSLSLNFAFPALPESVDELSESDYSEKLKKIIRVTRPAVLNDYVTIKLNDNSYNKIFSENEKDKVSYLECSAERRKTMIPFISGTKIAYSSTEFYQIEYRLTGCKAEVIE